MSSLDFGLHRRRIAPGQSSGPMGHNTTLSVTFQALVHQLFAPGQIWSSNRLKKTIKTSIPNHCPTDLAKPQSLPTWSLAGAPPAPCLHASCFLHHKPCLRLPALSPLRPCSGPWAAARGRRQEEQKEE